jgi:DNA-binding IclR family transcriptional regulator
MARPREKTTAMHKILEALIQEPQTAYDLADKIGMSRSTSRTTLSLLARVGLVEGKHNHCYHVTEEGKKRLQQLQQEAA